MEYKSSLKASLDVFERILTSSSSTVLTLRNLCRDLDEGKSLGAEAASKVCQLQNRVNNMASELTTVMEEFASLDSTVVEISWLHTERSKLDMTYINGDNPWDFSLSYSNKEELDEITETLKVLHEQNRLQRFETLPAVGQFVVCQSGKHFFRAQVSKIFQNGRAKVSKIDFNEDVILQSTYLFQIPKEIASIPCQSVRCCLNKEDQYLEERWGKELVLIFKKTLSECQLTVDILEKLNCFSPPKYHIRMYVFNEDTSEEMNLSTWINSKLLPDLKLLSSDEVEDMMAVLDEECMDPFLFGRVKTYDKGLSNLNLNIDPSNSKTSTSGVPSNSNSVSNQDEKQSKSFAAEVSQIDNEHLDEPDQHLIGLSVEKVSTWMHQYSDEETIKMNQRTAKLVVPVLEEPSFIFSKAKSSVASDLAKNPVLEEPAISFNKANSSVASDVAKNPVLEEPSFSFNKANSSVASDVAKSFGSSVKVEDVQCSSKSSSKMSVNAPEFHPSCFVEINPGCNEESFENVISNLEDEYQPQDEKRLCLFFQKKGYCKRIACQKEHVKRTNKWTDDVAEIFKGPFHNIDLPREGCTTFLQVQHVENATTFYSTLHEIYAEINEFGYRETLETLCQELNSKDITTSPHPLLETMPSIAEMVLALGLQRTLGPGRKWLRAVVTEILDVSTVEVFFSDFGNREIVSTKDVRKIRPQFLHLPSQAVLTTLSELQVVPGQKDSGKACLAKMIKGQTVKAEIVSRDVMNAELEVIVFDKNGDCINNLMAERGYCQPYSYRNDNLTSDRIHNAV